MTTTAPRLVLHGYWRSSSTYRVRFALAVKGLAYESATVNLLKEEHTAPAYRAKSAMGYVPCLEIDGQPIVESVAIIELLDEIFPLPPLYPKDPFARAHVRGLVELIAADTQPLQNRHVLLHVSSDPEAQRAWSRHFIARGLSGFEALMERHARAGVTGRYAYGDTLTAADAFLVPQLYNARRFGVDLAPFPRVVAAECAALATDAARAAAPENQRDAPADAK
jgi:maleylpyruvate isomerase